MQLSVSPLANAMGTVGVLHHGERLIGGNQRVDEHLAVLEMNVVIPSAVD
jgi:hypothetical protein